jgi:hypothetical protein
MFMRTTTYPGDAALATLAQQLQILNNAFILNENAIEDKNKRNFYPSTALKTHIHYCPKCDNENRTEMSRAMNMPGVKVCPVCGSQLMSVSIAKGYPEYDNGIPEEPNASPEVMLKYAHFAADFLNLAPDTNAEDIHFIIVDKMKEIGYLPVSNENKFLEYISDKGFFGLFRKNSVRKKYPSNLLDKREHPSHDTLLTLLFILYGNAESFMKELKVSNLSDFEKEAGEEGYKIVGNIRRNSILTLQHECGFQYVTTPFAFRRGFRCPKCDEKLSDEEIYERLIRTGWSGEYEPVDQYKGNMWDKLRIKHKVCGQEIILRPLDHIYGSTGCMCKFRISEKDIEERVNRIPGYRYIKGSKKGAQPNATIEIEHLICKTKFRIKVRGIETISCPVCRLNEFERKYTKIIKDLVGNEYTLIKLNEEVKRKHREVVIRHNKCGKETTYQMSSFTHGRRCPVCRVIWDKKKLEELLENRTNGLWLLEQSYIKGICKSKIVNSKTGEEKIILRSLLIQELLRPTPSEILGIEGYKKKDTKIKPESRTE